MLRSAGLRWAAVAARQSGWPLQRRRGIRAALDATVPNPTRDPMLAPFATRFANEKDRAGAPCDARPGW